MADLEISKVKSVHPGVDPQSWLGFEQRIQSRRFDALLVSARAALEEGNAALAQHALEEAREIRPNSREVDELYGELLRVATPPGQARILWRRAAGATSLLAIGVAMFIALDATRLLPQSLPVVAPPPRPHLLSVPTPRTLEIPLAPRIDVPPVSVVAATDPVAPTVEETPPLPQHGRTATPQVVQSRAESETLRLDVPARAVAANEDTAPLSAERRVSLADTVSAAPTVAPSVPVASPPPAAAIVAAKTEPPLNEQSRVAEVLMRYARAYGNLSVSAAREVWPGVDQRALARAFDSLASQSVSFDDCQIDVRGAVANASCRGQASYVGKVGRGTPRTEPRTWHFELRRDGETWKIENAEAKRTSG